MAFHLRAHIRAREKPPGWREPGGRTRRATLGKTPESTIRHGGGIAGPPRPRLCIKAPQPVQVGRRTAFEMGLALNAA